LGFDREHAAAVAGVKVSSRAGRVASAVPRLAYSAVALALAAGPVRAQTNAMKTPDSSGERAPRAKTPRRGSLFSAVSLADSPLGKTWSRLRSEAQARFPDLNLTHAEDLHITVVYVGGGWKREDLGRIRALALVAPTASLELAPAVARMGARDQVVAVELRGAGLWGDSVVAAKAALNRLGLKRPESYDANFRPHVTLAEARHYPPSAADAAELAGFQSWIAAEIAKDPGGFSVVVGPRTRVLLLLAGAARPKDGPEYIPVDDFLRQPPAGPPGN
jgi:2'-5' RNA ligase